VAQTAVAADLSQALDVKAGLAAKVTFDDVVLVDAITQLCFFLVGEVFNSGVGIDSGHFENLGCACSANTVDISETDLDSLVLGQVNAGYTCHINNLPFGKFAALRMQGLVPAGGSPRIHAVFDL
jgi:hypothetical protein